MGNSDNSTTAVRQKFSPGTHRHNSVFVIINAFDILDDFKINSIHVYLSRMGDGIRVDRKKIAKEDREKSNIVYAQ